MPLGRKPDSMDLKSLMEENNMSITNIIALVIIIVWSAQHVIIEPNDTKQIMNIYTTHSKQWVDMTIIHIKI